MTDDQFAVDKLSGLTYDFAQTRAALEAVYPVHVVYPWHDNKPYLAYKYLRATFDMSPDSFLSMGKPVPMVDYIWRTSKTQDYAIMYTITMQSEMRLYVYAKTPEGFAVLQQSMRDQGYL